ncbi:MAG: flavodoxin family protein [Olsenella sp.]
MRILVINGSPREQGNTRKLAEAFARGAEEVGNEILFVNVAKKHIAGCQGCQYCRSHEGKCVQRDDMQPILKALDTVDMVVFASPIYWFDITSQLKAVMTASMQRA